MSYRFPSNELAFKAAHLMDAHPPPQMEAVEGGLPVCVGCWTIMRRSKLEADHLSSMFNYCQNEMKGTFFSVSTVRLLFFSVPKQTLGMPDGQLKFS